MKRTIRVAVAAFLLAPVAVVATSSAPAGALAAPTLSVASGTPGTIVEVTSPDCMSDPGDDESFAVLQARLLVGVSPTQVLAGVGTGSEDPATIVVPDWVDASEPASIEATCFKLDAGSEDSIEVPLDPAEFDILPGADAPQQTRTFSRTSLRVGQGFLVSAAGCTLPGADFAGISLIRGDDSSDPDLVEVAFGGGPVDGTTFEAGLVASDGGIGYSVSSSLDDPDGEWQIDELTVDEYPNGVVPGPYLAIAYCSDPDGVNLFYEPQIIDVTGTSPTADVDLALAEPTRTATLAGSGCTAGDVDVYLEALDAREFLEDDDSGALQGDSSVRQGPFVDARSSRRRGGQIVSQPTPQRGRTARALADDGYLETTVTPEDGAWQVTDDVGFDQGFVSGFSACGDPFGDGFVYDPQAAVIDVRATPATPPSSTVPATPTPNPAPALAIPGRPSYAG